MLSSAKSSGHDGLKAWANEAIAKIQADFSRSSDTHLIKMSLTEGVVLYLKDESTHPTGSLKHRLARSLFLFGLCNGNIHQNTTIVEASSGNTAISEAYFSHLLGLPFIAVVPRLTSKEKIDKILFYHGRCHFVDHPKEVYVTAQKLADELDGYYMDQFSNAERVTDWRGNNNIAESIFMQLEYEPQPVADWIVVSAGTGGTSATIGRYIRYKGYHTQLCVADPENSVFYDYYQHRDCTLTCTKSSMIEGIGRPRVEPSFIPTVVDRMIKVPDAASLATLIVLQEVLGRKCGGSTGTNVYAALQIINAQTHANHERKPMSVVSMICDSGELYLNTYYNEMWRKQHCFELAPYLQELRNTLRVVA